MLISASDDVSAVLSMALDGLSLRQRVIADNIANIDTPNFIASSVDFESSLRSAIGAGDVAGRAMEPSLGVSATPAGPNGNNVDLQTETVTAMQSVFQYQLLTRAVGDRFSLITTAIGGR
jgi:flagellar basal-body rod protein FlgB